MDLRKRLYVKNYDEWADCSQRKCFSEASLELRQVPDGLILPVRNIPSRVAPLYEGGVMDGQGNFVAGSIRINKNYPGYLAVVRGYEVRAEEIEHKEEEVIFGGVLMDHFGHFFVESLSRLWYVMQHRDKGQKIVFITNGSFRPWMGNFLEYLGIAGERYSVLDHPVRFSSVLVPDESVHSWGHFFTREYCEIYACIRGKVQPSPYKKIYLTHRAFNNQVTCCNEKYFEDFFSARGFKVLSPEKYSLQEQLSFLKGAEEVACMVSTLSHLILFAEPQTRLIMLTRTNDEVLVAQCLINEVARADWYLVDVSQNFLHGDRVSGVVLLGTTEYWRDFVQEHYGVKVAENTLPANAFAYMQEWCRYYGRGDNLRKLDDEDFVSLFRQMYEVVLGRACPAEMLEKSPKEEHIEELEYKLGSEKNYVEALKELADNPVLIAYEITTDRYKPLCCYNGQICGKGTSPISDIRIFFTDDKVSCTYKLYRKEQGWTEARKSGEMVEAPGGHVYGLSIDLAPEYAAEFDISFRLHIGGGWSPWLTNGQSASQEKSPLDAIQMTIKKK